MTKPPSELDKINFVTKALIDVCDAPITVWIETFKPAILEAFITYYMVDIGQIWTSYVRPTQQVQYRRGRRKGDQGDKSGRKGKRGIISKVIGTDPSDEIARVLRGADRLSPTIITGGELHLWMIFGLFERAANWLFIISIVENFFFDWFSSMMATVYCQAQGAAVLVTLNPHLPQLGAAGWAASNMGETLKIRGPIEFEFSTGVIDDLPYSIIITATVRNVFDAPGTCGLRVYAGTSEGSPVLVQEFVECPPLGETSISLTYTGRGPQVFQIRDRTEGVNLDLFDLSMVVQSIEDE